MENTDEKLVSIVVPIYNVANYLERCIESLVNQTYKNIEIILVNDGSTDNSKEICKKYCNNFKNITLYNKKNGGLSDARNFGTKYANGDYIIYIDSDDYIDKSMIESLVKNIEKYDADVSVCGINNIYSSYSSPQCSNINILFTTKIQGFLRNYFIGKLIPGSIGNKLIRMNIAKQLSFPVGKIYEDAFYQYDLIKVAKKYVVSTKPFYNYFHRENSITTSPYKKKDLDYIRIYKSFYKYAKKNYPNLKKEAFFRLAYSYFFILDKMLISQNVDENDYKLVVKFLRYNFLKIILNPYFRMTRKVAAFALFINVRLYKLLLTMDKNIKKNNA